MKRNFLITITIGSVFIVGLAIVLALQWPSILQKYAVRQQRAEKIDTSEWKEYQDPAGRYTLQYPNNFFDLGPLGYYTTSNYHSFGPSSTPMQDEPYFELSAQEVLLTIQISRQESTPLADVTYLKQRHNWYEQSTLHDLMNKEYAYVAYGDVNVDAENTYTLSAIREISGSNVLMIEINSSSKEKIIKFRPTFEKIVERLSTSL